MFGIASIAKNLLPGAGENDSVGGGNRKPGAGM
jgi:hypothetical protein